MKVLMVYPATPDTFWSFKHVMRIISKRASIPPLGLLTVAAMLPKDWEIRLVDMNVSMLTDKQLKWADYVMVSAMIVHKEAIPELVRRCKQMGKPLIAGGPLFTTGHADFPDIDHFVLGEAEEMLPQLVEDMRHATVRKTYIAQTRPDISASPSPRWDLINFKHYANMAVQFSRGCPFDCEFCDIIIMNGRVPRAKAPAQLIGELEELRIRGWKGAVFIVDDNFIGNKIKAKALLLEIIQWRERTRAVIKFLTEASVNLADDPELCELMVSAGFDRVFLGIETPSVESLTECGKHQNCKRDLVETVTIIQKAGLEVMAGFIVGFDSDKADIFGQLYRFIQSSGVVTAMVGLLNALPQTRLHSRLQKEGRLVAGSCGNNTEMNFVPKLNLEFLIDGYREIVKKLYEPRNYYQRIFTFLEHYQPPRIRLRISRSDLQAFVKSFWFLGFRYRGRIAYWKFFITMLLRRPRHFHKGIELAIVGFHFRRVANLI